MLTTPFNPSSTATEVIEGIDLSTKSVVITGGATGIGLETTRALALTGAEILVGVRDTDKAEPNLERVRSDTGNRRIQARPLDLADLKSVDAFASTITGKVDILIANAGVMAIPERAFSAQGIELQFATNYLGHFALVSNLHQAMARANGARVVSVSSSGHLFCPVLFDDINFDFVPYTPFGAYGQSKTASILLSVGITNRWRDDGIVSNALHPGAIATGLQKYTGGLRTPEDRRKTVGQGAATSTLLAASPLIEGVGGFYFEDCKEAEVVDRRTEEFTGCARYALDPDNADRLWRLSDALLARL